MFLQRFSSSNLLRAIDHQRYLLIPFYLSTHFPLFGLSYSTLAFRKKLEQHKQHLYQPATLLPRGEEEFSRDLLFEIGPKLHQERLNVVTPEKVQQSRLFHQQLSKAIQDSRPHELQAIIDLSAAINDPEWIGAELSDCTNPRNLTSLISMFHNQINLHEFIDRLDIDKANVTVWKSLKFGLRRMFLREKQVFQDLKCMIPTVSLLSGCISREPSWMMKIELLRLYEKSIRRQLLRNSTFSLSQISRISVFQCISH